jgi:hypothetical protein
MFDDHVKRARRMLTEALDIHSKGDRNGALRKLQAAQEQIQGAGHALDGVAPKEVPMLPDHELWGWPRNGGRNL